MTNNTNTHAGNVAAIKALCEQSRAAKAEGTAPTKLFFPPGFTDEQKQAAANLVAGAEFAYGAALGAGKTRTFLASRLPPEAMAAIDYAAEDRATYDDYQTSSLPILEMITIWRQGCGNTMFDEDGKRIPMHQRPGLCECCTVGLIEAIERKEIANKGGAK